MDISFYRTRFFRIAVFIFCVTLFASCTYPQKIDYSFDASYSVSDPQFARIVSNLLDPPLLPGNKIVTLQNGDEIFPAMLDAIHSAESTVNFETHVYWAGDIGHRFALALAERAKSNVQVRVLVDAYGAAQIDHKDVALMKDAGVKYEVYHPFNIFDPNAWKNFDHRTHRKLLIIDGKLAFTGGVGIADMWTGHAQDKDHWRDTHYKIEGPIVNQIQGIFADNWVQLTGEVLDSKAFFPKLETAGQHYAQVFKSSPQSGSESMQLLMLFSIAHAAKTIRIESAYFVPDERTRNLLIKMALRGVKIQIIVPGRHIDEKIVRMASRASWGSLLEVSGGHGNGKGAINNGGSIEIYEYQPTMIHCKLLIVDDFWTSIGSANMDNRSFRINDEANLNVLDQDFAASQIKMFDADLTRSHRITYAEWKRRSLWEILTENFANPLRPEL